MHRDRLREKQRLSFRSNDGWWSRGYLPHFDASGVLQFVTIRLADSLPQAIHAQLRADLDALNRTRNSTHKKWQAYRQKLEGYLDAGYGSCFLRRNEIAAQIVDSITHLVAQGHSVDRWVIMPNHLHLLISVRDGYSLSKVIRFFKGYTARRANKLLGRSGDFWYPEFFDRYIRDARHLDQVVRYIDDNPVKAGLVERPTDWYFGSAGQEASGKTSLTPSSPEAQSFQFAKRLDPAD